MHLILLLGKKLCVIRYQDKIIFALGYRALYSNNDGSSNIAIGYNAGRYITDGSTANTTGDYNIFIGPSTKPPSRQRPK